MKHTEQTETATVAEADVEQVYHRGSIVPLRGRDESLIGWARTRGTVMTAAGSTYVRDPLTGELVWPNKHVKRAWQGVIK